MFLRLGYERVSLFHGVHHMGICSWWLLSWACERILRAIGQAEAGLSSLSTLVFFSALSCSACFGFLCDDLLWECGLSHSLISCCTNDGEQLENSVHCAFSVLDHILLPYYLVLPAASGPGRDFGLLASLEGLIFAFLPTPTRGWLCYFVIVYPGCICEVYE